MEIDKSIKNNKRYSKYNDDDHVIYMYGGQKLNNYEL